MYSKNVHVNRYYGSSHSFLKLKYSESDIEFLAINWVDYELTLEVGFIDVLLMLLKSEAYIGLTYNFSLVDS